MFKRTAMVALIAMGLAAGVATAGGNGSGKFAILGSPGQALCNGNGVIQGDDNGSGFAVFNAPENGTVSVTVSVKGLLPNTTYHVWLVQANDGNCGFGAEDAAFTTNGQGNGTVHHSELSTAGLAFLHMRDNLNIGAATEFYVTASYAH